MSKSILGWFSLLCFASCGSSEPSADTACSDLAKVRCAKRTSCSNGASITSVYGDMSTCLAREQLSCTVGLAAPQTGNSPTKVEECVAAYPGFSCADFFSNNPPAACIATGQKPMNASCAVAGQCATT